MNRLINRFALPLCAVLIAFMAYKVFAEVSTDASPAVTACAQAERQGLTCKIGAKTYQSQIIATDDGAGTTHTFLIVEDGKNVVTVITLN